MSDKLPLTENYDNSHNLNNTSATPYELQNIDPIKKQLDAENATRIAEGKKKIPVRNYNKKLKELSEAEAFKHTDGFFHLQQTKILNTLGPNTKKIVTKLRQNVDDHSNYLIIDHFIKF